MSVKLDREDNILQLKLLLVRAKLLVARVKLVTAIAWTIVALGVAGHVIAALV